MAQIELTLYHIPCYGVSTKSDTETNSDVTVASEIKTPEIPSEPEAKSLYLKVGSAITQYSFYLVNISFQKKVYQPTEVIAELQVKGGSTIPMSMLEKTFKHVKVELKCDGAAVGSDYYVHEVQARYKKDGMYVSLKIYSLDKLLTINKVSRAFVAQKLTDSKKSILSAEMAKYEKPYTITDTTTESKTVGYDATNMQHLIDGSNEHIHPYLVQYNESFYDFLARTANRWGEFMYYEDGKLRFGYNKASTPTPVTNYTERYYFDIYHADNGKNPSVATDGNYDVLASNEKQFTDTTLKKSPNSISGIMYCPGDKFDKVVMKKLANFFKNDKSLPTFIVNEIVDDTIEIGSKAVQRDYANDKFDNEYFPNSDSTHYQEQRNSDKDKFNQFTEIDTKYDDTKYLEILAKEQASGRNALHINFDTTYPKLTLGQMIEVDGQYYIVVEVSCKKMTSVDYALEEQTDADGNKKIVGIKKDTTFKYVFEVVALGGNAKSSSNSKDFYPAVIPAGHICQAEPQIATISDAKDPSGDNQVRVLFPWQSDETEATPWLRFTTNASGAPTVGRHYKGNKVLIGFINGNVERPYVLGGLEAKGDKSADVIETSPGGHYLKINDDPSGLSKFLTGMFLPGWKSLSAFVPQMGELPETKGDTGVKLGGGFELSDYYGIYKISGSTDGRNVTVASPWGNVAVNAFTGITISAPNGDVKITGKNVMIEAGNNLTLTSGTNVKKRLWDGSWSGFGNNLGADIATAVAKKLADVGLNLITIDLTIVRNVFDIVFRPLEGKLLVKSNRYLMLESGKGECVYPETAFKDGEKREQAIKKRAENDFRPGLELASGVKEIAQKINSIGNLIAQNWLDAYNQCVEAKHEFESIVEDAAKCANDYNGANKPVICKTYKELQKDLWADSEELLKDNQIGFKDDNYNVSSDDDVKNPYLQKYMEVDPDLDPTKADDVALAKTEIRQFRERKRAAVLNYANNIRTKIIALRKCCNGLNEDDMKKELATIKTRNVPKSFKDAIANAFKKENVGDSELYSEIPDHLQELNKQLDINEMSIDKIVLKRKAATLWLEKVGFKDEWRKKVPVRDNMGNIPDPNVTAVPPRKFNFMDIADDYYWEDYLNSLTAVPKLSPVQYKVASELAKTWKAYLDKMYFWKNIYENMSWGEAKNGGILFSFDQHTYGLKDTIDTHMETIAKEKLTELDDQGLGITSFLNSMRDVMKTYK